MNERQEPETCGQLTTEEIRRLNSSDVVMVRVKSNPGIWAVGDVNTLESAGMWDGEFDVFNIKKVSVASRSAHRRWVYDTYFDREMLDDERY